MRRKRAISLVELLAVMSGCSAVLGLTATLLHQTMRSQSQTRHYFDVERTAQRLSRQFRLDVHAASEASAEVAADDEQGVFRLRFPEGKTVEYQRGVEKIVRVVKSSTGESMGREDFSFGAPLTLEVSNAEFPPAWTLRLIADPPAASIDAPSRGNVRAAPVRLQVLAVLGRDHRYAQSGESQEDLP